MNIDTEELISAINRRGTNWLAVRGRHKEGADIIMVLDRRKIASVELYEDGTGWLYVTNFNEPLPVSEADMRLVLARLEQDNG